MHVDWDTHLVWGCVENAMKKKYTERHCIIVVVNESQLS